MTNRYEKHFLELLNLDFSVYLIVFSILVESCRVETVERTCRGSKNKVWSFLTVQRLKLLAPNAGGTGPDPWLGIKILHASWYSQKIKDKIKK